MLHRIYGICLRQPGRILASAWAIAPLFLWISSVSDPLHAAPPTRTWFQYTSAPGDSVGAGGSERFTPANATFQITGNDINLSFLIRTTATPSVLWVVSLNAPTGEKLRPGRYYNVERAPDKTGRAPGLHVFGANRACNEVWGSFSINQISADSAGNVTMLDVTFTQRCGSPSAPPLTGAVKFNERPLQYAFTSDPGEPIGNGKAKTYYGDTSIFSLIGNDAYFEYKVSGQRDYWWVRVLPPSGQQLHVGTYSAVRDADSTNASLRVSSNGATCGATDGSITGTVTITGITKDASGNIIGLRASFEHFCFGGPPLRGEIRYYR